MNAPSGRFSTMDVAVETRILGCGTSGIDVRLPAREIRVSDLIRAKIEAEWSAGGAVGRESADPEALAGDAAPWQSIEDAVRHACDAHRAGWYIILVDGQSTTGLDQLIAITSQSRIAFVRMCPLPDR